MHNILLGIVSVLLTLLHPAIPRADILIVSPHPDDAVLCCSGVIQRALKNHESVTVVNLTNGDAFTYSASLLFDKDVAALTPRDMIRYAKIRQREDILALRVLGLPPDRIYYLGYPDSHLAKLSAARSPVSDLTKIINAARPSSIYVTSSMDAATDHEAAYAYTKNAARTTGIIHTAVIHTNPGQVLPKPAQTVPLTQEELAKKIAAIRMYYTQYGLLLPHHPDFDMMWFARPTEVFYTK